MEKNREIRTRNFAKSYVGVPISDGIGRKDGQLLKLLIYIKNNSDPRIVP